VWTADTSGQNTLICASPALYLLVQTTGHWAALGTGAKALAHGAREEAALG